MNPDERLELGFEDFRRQLADVVASGRTARRPWRPALLVPAVAVAIAAAVVGVFVLDDAGRLNVVERAEAAIDPAGAIVHMKVTSLTGEKLQDAQTTEVWSATDPTRWRYVQDVPQGSGITDDAGSFRGREEFAYAGGELQDYKAERDVLEITPKPTADAVPSSVPLDPQRDIRPMLERGELHDDGEVVVDGRRVHRLVGEVGAADGSGRQRVTYDVDASTFEPVSGEVDLTTRSAAGAGAREQTFRVVYRIDSYERLPDDAAHAGLLQIRTTAQTTVRQAKRP